MYQRNRANRYRKPMARRAYRKTAGVTREELEDYGIPESVIDVVEDYGLEYIDDPGDIEYYEDVYDEGALGEAVVDMLGGVDQLEKQTLELHFDYESFGLELVTGDGYTIENGVAFRIL